MTEGEQEVNWVESLSIPQKSQIIFIRHGDSKYTGNGSDLTSLGIEQVANTAKNLEVYLKNFDSVIIVASPASRAKLSSKVFVEKSQITPDLTKKSEAIRPFDMKNLGDFLKYDKKHSTPIYGQMWLTDKFLAQENPLTEARTAVDQRSCRFLYHYGKAIERIAESNGKKVCVLVFTHMEVGINYLQGIYPGTKGFPVESEPVLENGEPVIIQLDNPQKEAYTIMARGKVSRVIYDNTTKNFVQNN